MATGADPANDFGQRVVHRARIGEQLRRGVLEEGPALLPLALGDVAADAAIADELTGRVEDGCPAVADEVQTAVVVGTLGLPILVGLAPLESAVELAGLRRVDR